MMKNLVQFHYGPLHTLVTFISHPKFYGIIISQLPVVECEPHKVCERRWSLHLRRLVLA